jgi:DNA-directed RNA polymerase subunit omega
MTSDLVQRALAKIGDPNVLVNLISRRVRQLNSGNGSSFRPLIADVGKLSAADIALQEISEGKMGFELPEFVPLVRPTSRGGNRPKHWAKT